MGQPFVLLGRNVAFAVNQAATEPRGHAQAGRRAARARTVRHPEHAGRQPRHRVNAGHLNVNSLMELLQHFAKAGKIMTLRRKLRPSEVAGGRQTRAPRGSTLRRHHGGRLPGLARIIGREPGTVGHDIGRVFSVHETDAKSEIEACRTFSGVVRLGHDTVGPGAQQSGHIGDRQRLPPGVAPGRLAVDFDRGAVVHRDHHLCRLDRGVGWQVKIPRQLHRAGRCQLRRLGGARRPDPGRLCGQRRFRRRLGGAGATRHDQGEQEKRATQQYVGQQTRA